MAFDMRDDSPEDQTMEKELEDVKEELEDAKNELERKNSELEHAECDIEAIREERDLWVLEEKRLHSKITELIEDNQKLFKAKTKQMKRYGRVCIKNVNQAAKIKSLKASVKKLKAAAGNKTAGVEK